MHYQFDFSSIWSDRDEIFWGAMLTLRLSAIAMALSLIFAIVGSALRIVGPLPVRFLISAYIEVIRNTPFIIQIFIVYFALPAIGLRMGPDASALVALVLNGSAYTIEIVRAGIDHIGRGQIEAARALSLKRLQTYRHIVLPQALQAVLPPLESQFIILLLSSSIVSAIAANELTSVVNHISSDSFRSFEAYITGGAIYLVMSLLFSALFAIVNRLLFSRSARRV